MRCKPCLQFASVVMGLLIGYRFSRLFSNALTKASINLPTLKTEASSLTAHFS